MKKILIRTILASLKIKKINNIKNFNFVKFSSIDSLSSNSIAFNLDKIKKVKIHSRIKNVIIFATYNKNIKNNIFFIKVKNPRFAFYLSHKFIEKFSHDIDRKKFFLIEKNVFIGKNVKFIDRDKVFIGSNSYINNCVIGKNCNISSNVVIGNDGFGYFKYKNKNYKQPHFGKVILENNVDIGPQTNIERGHFKNTILRKDTKIDALVQIGHNCEIGTKTIICAGSILSGNVKVGKNVWIGPKSSFKEKIKIGDNSLIGLGSNVICDIKKNKIVFGNPAKYK
jgi:UDP-3-O-[3-hydroxymyristoyl] glucosamine N-acyltransferase